MTAVERLARELFTEAYPGRALEAYPRFIFSAWCRLARHVLRRERAAVRRARGRTLGWCAIPDRRHVVADYVSVSRRRLLLDNARVVAVPKPKRRRKA